MANQMPAGQGRAGNSASGNYNADGTLRAARRDRN
jgi:hypothetical protein